MSLPDYHIIVSAGPHDRQDCPVMLKLPPNTIGKSWRILDENGHAFPLQALKDDRAAFIVSDLPAGQSRTYRLDAFLPDSQPKAKTPIPIHLAPEDGRLTILRNGHLFTQYVYAPVPARPYFYPLMAPGQVAITRSYPMADVPGETRDHPHHRSLWLAFGEVNGVDNWSEESGHGYTTHQTLDRLENGEVAGRFATTSLWSDAAHKPVLTQNLTVTVWGVGESLRLMDLVIHLTASHGDVHFGDTKEGGIVSARVASSLDVPRGGRIENVFGGINEAETWGKAAHWCDYSGIIDSQHVGIAIMDHPLSFRYPTHWHVRDYGLMTANPFGYAAYTHGAKNGAHHLASGETLSFQYRILLHRGDATEGQVNAHYLNFAAPPRVEIVS